MKYIFLLCFSFFTLLAEVTEKPYTLFIAKDSLSLEFIKAEFPLNLPNATEDYWIKVVFKEDVLHKEPSYVFKIRTQVGRNYLEVNSTYPQDLDEENLFHLSDSRQNTYLFKLKNVTNNIWLDGGLLSEREYLKNKRLRNTLYGISYGVMLSAIFYYFAFFLYSKIRTHIFYSLTQLFMLIMLIQVTQKSENVSDELSFALAYCGFLLFTTLFTHNFLQLKNHSALYTRLLFVTTTLLIIDAFTNIFTIMHIPVTLLMLSYLLIALIIYKKTHFTHILFYIAGWGLLIFSFVFIELEIYFFQNYIINPDDVLHITMPLESLILAFALAYKMRKLEDEKRQKEQMLIHYDKRASIGDMLENIAHQWRQPLTHIGYIVMNISAAIRNNKLTDELWSTKERELNLQLEYMSQSIDDFSNFYRVEEQHSLFKLSEAVQSAYKIIQPSLDENSITLKIITESDSLIKGSKNELAQAILNLLSNAKEAAGKNSVQNVHINIKITENSICVEDNCGGVKASLQESLFEAYVSSKKSGGGVGLSMSKLIIKEHFQAELTYKPLINGSAFCIEFKSSQLKRLDS